MSLETHHSYSPVEECRPDFELAGNLQAVLNDIENRDFNLEFQQEEALTALGHALVDGLPSGYIEMATSTGKTAVEALLAEAAVKNNKRVLVLAPKIQIAEQIIGTDETQPTGLQRFAQLPESTKVMSHFGGDKADKSANIVVSTYVGFINDAKNNHAQLGKFDVVIADECHRSLGAETSKTLKTAFPDAFKVGLSATPDFAINRKSDQVYDRQLYEFSLIEAIETGRAAPLRALVYETDETIVTDQRLGDFTERELAPLIENLQRNGTALELTQSLVAEGRQGVVACIPGENNLHARKMAQLLQESGIRSMDVGSHLTPDEQKARLQLFKAGEIDVLTFTRALEEGWDSNRASFAINMAPTTSPVRTKQLIGRVLRRKAEDSESIFIDFIDRTNGYVKNQYTALHALDLEYVDLTRTLGKPQSRAGRRHHSEPQPLDQLNPRLMELLSKSHGKRISDILAAVQVNPEVQKWERILQDDFKKDGESAVLPDHLVFDETLHRKYEKARSRFVALNGVEPTADELIAELGKIPGYQKEALAHYAFRLPLDTVLDELAEQPDEDSEDEFDEVLSGMDVEALKQAMVRVLNDQEYGVMMLGLGLVSHKNYAPSYALAALMYHIRLRRAHYMQYEAAEKLREHLDIDTPHELRSLGEYLGLYANFDVRHPKTTEQGQTVYALLALERFARSRVEGPMQHNLRTPTEIVDAFNVGSIAVAGHETPSMTIDIPALVLPVAENLWNEAKRHKYKEDRATLQDAINSLRWLAQQPDDQKAHVEVSVTPIMGRPDPRNIAYGLLPR